MPSGYDYLRESTLELVSCVVEAIDSDDIFNYDEEKLYLKVVDVLDGNPNFLGQSFTISFEDHDIDENSQLFKAELEITEDEESNTPSIRCTSIEVYKE